jgi:hypothetical protein
MAKKMKIRVDARSGTTGVDYEQSVNDGPAGHGPVDLPPGSGTHEITFTIKDTTGLGLQFPASDQFLCEVNSGSHCPTTLDNSQFEISSSSTSKKLVVLDLNSGPPREYRYQLNIVDSAGNPYPYDPIIKNGGGGKKTSIALIVVVVVVGVAAVAAVGALLGLWKF